MEPCALDGHLDGTADLPQGHPVADELGDRVPGGLGDLHEVPVAVGPDLHGPGGVADVTVELGAAVHLDDVTDLEDGLVVAAGRVMGSYLVYADVTGERETASVLTDVALHLLRDIVELHSFLDHGEPELPGRSRHLSGGAELRKLFFIQHSKTSLIFSAGIAPWRTISTSLSMSQTMVDGCPIVQAPASM